MRPPSVSFVITETKHSYSYYTNIGRNFLFMLSIVFSQKKGRRTLALTDSGRNTNYVQLRGCFKFLERNVNALGELTI